MISGTIYILTTTSISILNIIHVHNAKITKLLKYVFWMICCVSLNVNPKDDK